MPSSCAPASALRPPLSNATSARPLSVRSEPSVTVSTRANVESVACSSFASVLMWITSPSIVAIILSVVSSCA
eukprot:2183279-Prymnesium_polylepis.2